METENHLIKSLIISLGFSADSVKRYLQLADQNTVADRKVAIPAAMGRPLRAPAVASNRSPCSTSSSQVTPSVPVEGKDSVKQPLLGATNVYFGHSGSKGVASRGALGDLLPISVLNIVAGDI
ncbi:hypothetical protein N7539_003237 [Penicillium diatomitis]|uniref:Uncharacterized protein n=1 Tax=Penicillium diatomitis TaxID=2819901 RepID=A0A9W9XG66_9EURO|nr:uncharacterized protein N7539_003237 [Penicillium diatomitis]KAJ5491670.1 hypothetical protein N7539_003237 [Penicillium diatomitis]